MRFASQFFFESFLLSLSIDKPPVAILLPCSPYRVVSTSYHRISQIYRKGRRNSCWTSTTAMQHPTSCRLRRKVVTCLFSLSLIHAHRENQVRLDIVNGGSRIIEAAPDWLWCGRKLAATLFVTQGYSLGPSPFPFSLPPPIPPPPSTRLNQEELCVQGPCASRLMKCRGVSFESASRFKSFGAQTRAQSRGGGSLFDVWIKAGSILAMLRCRALCDFECITSTSSNLLYLQSFSSGCDHGRAHIFSGIFLFSHFL